MLKTFFQARFPENAFFHFFLSVCVLILTGVLCVSDAFAKAVFVLRMEDDILSVSDWPNSDKNYINNTGVSALLRAEGGNNTIESAGEGATISVGNGNNVITNTEDGVG